MRHHHSDRRLRRSSPHGCCSLRPEPLHGQDGFRFKSGVELVNVNITVTDRSGRFVEGLRQEDFVVYDDNQEQEVTHFSAERVPVSLGVALDTSGSMVGEKIESARAAIDRFLLELLGPDDEVFLMRFGASAELVHDWTNDKALVSRRLARINPAGGTAMYDAVAESVPLATQGQHRKKAILLDLGRQRHQQPHVGPRSEADDPRDRGAGLRGRHRRQRRDLLRRRAVDAAGRASTAGAPALPVPGRRRRAAARGRAAAFPAGGGGRGGGRVYGAGNDDRVNVAALREITDDSGGRTEIVRTARDLDPATENIADELSKQYYLGYPAPGHKTAAGTRSGSR